MLPKGTGWSEEGRASCQQAVGRQGEQEGWLGQEGAADVFRESICLGKERVWGSWEIAGDGRSQEAEGNRRQLPNRKEREGEAGGRGGPAEGSDADRGGGGE